MQGSDVGGISDIAYFKRALKYLSQTTDFDEVFEYFNFEKDGSDHSKVLQKAMNEIGAELEDNYWNADAVDLEELVEEHYDGIGADEYYDTIARVYEEAAKKTNKETYDYGDDGDDDGFDDEPSYDMDFLIDDEDE